MLDVRLYEDFKSMMENEGRNEEVLEKFFNDMIEEQNFDLSFYQWYRKNLPFKSLGNIYVYADERLGEQVEEIEKLIEDRGYYIDDLKLEEIQVIITIENALKKELKKLTPEKIFELLTNDNEEEKKWD